MHVLITAALQGGPHLHRNDLAWSHAAGVIFDITFLHNYAIPTWCPVCWSPPAAGSCMRKQFQWVPAAVSLGPRTCGRSGRQPSEHQRGPFSTYTQEPRLYCSASAYRSPGASREEFTALFHIQAAGMGVVGRSHRSPASARVQWGQWYLITSYLGGANTNNRAWPEAEGREELHVSTPRSRQLLSVHGSGPSDTTLPSRLPGGPPHQLGTMAQMPSTSSCLLACDLAASTS